MSTEAVKMVAIRAIVDQGIERSSISKVTFNFPKLTSTVTATIVATVHLVDGCTTYSIPIAVRVEYTHPIALN